MMNNVLFATPFFKYDCLDKSLMSSLESFVLGHMSENMPQNNRPQSAHNDLYESSFDFLTWKFPVIQKCKEYFFHHLLKSLQQATSLSNETIMSLKINHESWYHVARNGGYFQPHTHPNASWSMVLCVNQGDEVTKNERESGHLLFLDPRHNAAMHLDKGNKDLNRQYSFNGYRFRPANGELLAFPSYLQHAVEPYYGEKKRITIAANFWLL